MQVYPLSPQIASCRQYLHCPTAICIPRAAKRPLQQLATLMEDLGKLTNEVVWDVQNCLGKELISARLEFSFTSCSSRLNVSAKELQ